MNFSEHIFRLEGVAGYYLALSFSIPHPVGTFGMNENCGRGRHADENHGSFVYSKYGTLPTIISRY